MIVDSEACTGAHDVLQLENASGSPLTATNYSGYHQGDVWTDWVTQPADGGVVVHFSGDNANQSNACSGGAQYAYAGFVVNEVEYRKRESGAPPYQPLFRAAGQYFDSETDLFQNWNRYYNAESGTYLSPEPLLQTPDYSKAMASQGGRCRRTPTRQTTPSGALIRRASTRTVSLATIRGPARVGSGRTIPSGTISALTVPMCKQR
jgi:RHS repeat-associated protein